MDMNNDDIEDKEKEENLNGIPVSKDEPIYAISDFEGRYDYYIRFLMDIGFLKKEKLKNIITNKCTSAEERKICKAFFDENINNFLQDTTLDDNDIRINENVNRIYWLKRHLTPLLISQAINTSFTGKIVVNGDLYSDRHKSCLMTLNDYDVWPNVKRTISAQDVIKLIRETNQLCYTLLTNLNTYMPSCTNNNNNNNKIFLIAGNHDLYECDFITKKGREDYLQDVKNDSLHNMQLLKFVKFKIGDKTMVFKHSPHLSKDALGYIERNNHMVIEEEQIRRYPNDTSEEKHSYYWKYANNGLGKEKVDAETIFCNEPKENAKINKQLQKNNYYMVFGHCGVTTSNSSTYSIIDKDWNKYQYSKFSIDKEQLKHEVYYYDNNKMMEKTFNIKNFKKAKRRNKKINNKKLSMVSNNEIYYSQQQQQQQKNFNVLKAEKQKRFSINNNVLKKEQSTKTENKIKFSECQQIKFTYNGINSSNSVCGLNACCNWIDNTCG